MKRAAVFLFLLSVLSTWAAPTPEIAAVLQRGSAHEITVIYDEAVNVNTLANPDNYSVAPGNVFTLRLCATNHGVVLTALGLPAAGPGVLNISGMKDTSGNLLAPTTLPFVTTPRFWALIGDNELGFKVDAFGFPEDGYDLSSGSIQQNNYYDDATFMGELVRGSFEAKVRVEYVDPAGGGAKAGIMVREFLDANKRRPRNPSDPEQAFSRYVELAVSAPVSARGEVSDSHRIWQRREFLSAVTDSLTVTNDAAPAFTNAWLRVERVGQQFLFSRGVDGETWERLGSATFPQTLPEDVYVGLAFSPQNDDLPPQSGLRKSFVAKFREYSLKPVPEGNLRIDRVGDHAEVSWESGWILETALAVTGKWATSENQQSPLRVSFEETMQFFRLRRLAP